MSSDFASDWIGAFLQQERLPEAYRATIDQVLTPLTRIIATELKQSEFLLVGLCGAQGSGKSTAAVAMQTLLQRQGLPTAVLSIDDFYHTRAVRERLAQDIHPLLITRGVPGTHDLQLGLDVIDSLRNAGPTLLPRFDKARDDRRPKCDWPTFVGPARIVILEGWCVGAVAQPLDALGAPVNILEAEEDAAAVWRGFVNAQLAGPYQALFASMSLLLLLKAPSFENVFLWRLEQEHKLRERIAESGGGSRVMSDAEVARFISHYERITRHILQEMPSRADYVLDLDSQRRMRSLD